MTRRMMLANTLFAALRREEYDSAANLLRQHAASGYLRAAVLDVRNNGKTWSQSFGEARQPDAVFLLASISKPMTATAAMRLVDHKELALADPVQKYIPEFRGGDKAKVTVQHLLTHSSGLPDMLPENDELRKRHAPLSDFVAGTCRTPLLFEPGTQTRYQSMGILLAAEIVSRITKQPLPDYLREHVFQPLGMKQTSLGLGGRKLSDTMQVQVTDDPDWNWNSPYWRNLASPWGGAHATAADISRFLHYFAKPDAGVLQPATAASMIVDHNPGRKPYGIGWAVQSDGFGKGLSAKTFGHGGSTGTLAWYDPEKDLSFVLLTTKPSAQSNKTLLKPAAELIASGARTTA